jgi:hypothetical protein
MNQCAGWSISKHETKKPIKLIVFFGCKFCGGFDCGDFPDASYLCPDCLQDLMNNPEFKLNEDYEFTEADG